MTEERSRDRRVPIHVAGVVSVFALVDEDDFPALIRHRWRLDSRGYAVRNVRYGPRREGRQRAILMHREILGLRPGDGVKTDHRNRDPLDNRRENLRVCTYAENNQNVPARGGSSEYRGVSWNKRARRWTATVRLRGKQHHLGYFDDELEAAGAAADFRREHMPYAEEAQR
jgi:hypothetical protein